MRCSLMLASLVVVLGSVSDASAFFRKCRSSGNHGSCSYSASSCASTCNSGCSGGEVATATNCFDCQNQSSWAQNQSSWAQNQLTPTIQPQLTPTIQPQLTPTIQPQLTQAEWLNKPVLIVPQANGTFLIKPVDSK